MPSMTTCRQQYIVLVPFPFSDLSTVKKRPALVISADWYNQDRDDCILVAITSVARSHLAPDEVPIRGVAATNAGLTRDAIIVAGKIFTIEQDLVQKQLGFLPRSMFDQVLVKVHDLMRDSCRRP